MALNKTLSLLNKQHFHSLLRRCQSSSFSALGWKIENYRYFIPIQTRWTDNDENNHINNSVYYQFIDVATTSAYQFILEKGGVPLQSAVRAKTSCTYRKPMRYPQIPLVGVGISRLGKSSVELMIGFFEPSSEDNDDLFSELDIGLSGSLVDDDSTGLLAKHYMSKAAVVGNATVVLVSKSDLTKSIPFPPEFVTAANSIAINK